MNQEIAPSFWSYLKEQYPKTPLEIRTFVVFSVLATLIVPLSLVFGFKLALIPYFGWGSTFFMYTVALILAVSARLSINSKTLTAMLFMLWLSVIFGIISSFLHLVMFTEPSTNPYLQFSTLQPLFTIALPLAWIFTIGSKSVKGWAATN